MSGWLGRLFGLGKGEPSEAAERRVKADAAGSAGEKSEKAVKSAKRKGGERSSAPAVASDNGRRPPKVRPARRKGAKTPEEMTGEVTSSGGAPEASYPLAGENVTSGGPETAAAEMAGEAVAAGTADVETQDVGTPDKASDAKPAAAAASAEGMAGGMAGDAKPAVAVSGSEAASTDKRVLLQQGVSGEYVRRVQSALVTEGFELGAVDGVFGRMTLAALKRLQKKLGVKPDGVVSFGLWRDVTKQPVPDVFARCLQITSAFEGHGFTKIAGNFDNAGVTWGTIGYNIRSRSLQPIMDYFIDYRPDLVREAFGPLAEELVRVMESSLEEQMTWGDQISIGTQKHRISSEWAHAFARFGAMDEVQEMQLTEAREKYWALAERDCKRFDLTSELGAALAFDIAVQCGGVDAGEDSGPELREIERRFEEDKPKRERDRRVIIADVVANHSHPRYVFDVLSRKMTLATGEGTVHGKSYHADHWGLGDYPLADT